MLKICDSIAVKVLNESKLLVAVGNELNYYNTGAKNEKLPWKLNRKIHGIELNETKTKILIYGEKDFLLLSYKNEELSKITNYSISDWISSAKFLEDDKFCLLTAHLVLIELQFDYSTRSCKVLRQSSCDDKSTLYSSLIIGDIWNNLLVFGGTAMELVVWQPISKVVLCRLSGNNGVILSININLKFNLLTTTSDDRSIKFFNIKLDRDKIPPHKLLFTFSNLFKQGFAHTARVFQGKIIEENGQPYAISVGEDSNLCLWNCQGQLIFKRQHHFGATIWNFDYDPITKTVYTTGSDGNCISYNLKSQFTQNISKILASATVNDSENLEKIKFLTENHIIAVTNKYNVMIRKNDSDWKYIRDYIAFKCTVLQVFKEFVCLAGFKKLILLKFDYHNQKFEKIFDSNILNGVIRSVCFLSDKELLACDEIGYCTYILDNFKTIVQLETPQCKERWITSALKIDDFIIFSNRQGNLYLYLFENDSFILKSSIKRVNGKLGATKIILEDNSKNIAIIKTCGHDNTIKIIKLDKILHNIKIISRQNVPIAWVEKLEKTENTREYLMGFNSTDFVLWSKRDDIIVETNCGGGHRFWDCKLNEWENKIKLIYIKKGQLFMFESELRNIQINQIEIPRKSWHVKPCNSINLIKYDANTIIFSGGEDNILKISELTNNILYLKQEMCLHISSIKTIAVIKYLNKFLIFSAGGRAQICLCFFNPETYEIEEKCNYMLKCSDFTRKFLRNTKEIDFDPETRIMSIAINEKNDEIFEIFAGCSDGYIRKFIYNLKLDIIEFSDELLYNKCILHIKIIKKNLLISAATDGYLIFWNLNDFCAKSVPLFRLEHHKNGVNSLDIKMYENNDILLVTGGDDQKVVISIIKIHVDSFNVIYTKLFDYLHSAQVNGIKISDNLDYFYTVSVDQTICKIDINNYKLIKKISTCVPDIKGIDLIPSCVKNENIITVYGCGIESFQI